MKLFTLLCTLLATACATAPSTEDDGPAVTDGDIDQQASASHGAGKGDGAGTSKDPRLLNCHLEYQRVSPDFASRPAATFETTFGTIENTGGGATDGTYTLVVGTNPSPPYNLSFEISLWDLKANRELSYIVLPRPHVGGAFLFELGAPIPPATFAEGSFDSLRAYCSIRMP